MVAVGAIVCLVLAVCIGGFSAYNLYKIINPTEPVYKKVLPITKYNNRMYGLYWWWSWR